METEETLQKKSRIELFKYNAVLSAIFFFFSTFYLSTKLPDYSFSYYTISQMSYFLNPSQLSFFNLLFIIKCILDLSFTYYVFRKFELKLNAVTSVIWLLAVLSFGLIGFFPVHQYRFIHWMLAGNLFLFWTISEYIFARITKDQLFLTITNNIIFAQATTIILFFTFNQITAIFEIIYAFLVLIWLIIFIGKFL